MRKRLAAGVLAVGLGMSGAVLTMPATAGATEAPPALVHATPENECKLNVRAGSDVGAQLLGTLTCNNYTTCSHTGDVPCGPFVTGGVYSCVGADKKQLTDNRWAEVNWRSSQKSYVAVGCAAFRV